MVFDLLEAARTDTAFADLYHQRARELATTLLADAPEFQVEIASLMARVRAAVDARDWQQVGEAVRAGTSLVVFPEGTRSKDGRILPFKKGPFVVAKEAGVPVVPVAISGSGRVTPKDAIAVVPGTIRVAVGEPVDPRAFATKEDLLAEVRRRVVALHRSIGGLGGTGADVAGAAARTGARA